MTLATFDALDALRDAFDGADDLPALGLNDLSLEGFADSGTAGVRWKFSLIEGPPRPMAIEIGAPPVYEADVRGELVFAVEGVAGDPRETVFRAGVASMSAVLFPDGHGLTVAGKFEDFMVRTINRRLFQAEAGRLPIDAFYVEFGLFVSAPTPFG